MSPGGEGLLSSAVLRETRRTVSRVKRSRPLPSRGEDRRSRATVRPAPPGPPPWELHLTEVVAEASAARPYRPRHPERTPFSRFLERDFEDYVRAHEKRYEPGGGPLRPVVRRAVEGFLECGRLNSGFARIRCPKCRGEHLLAFSCRMRNFCPSCHQKRSILFAERLREEILSPAASHRQLVFTIPRALRALFERERRLLSLLSRTAHEATRRSFAAMLDRPDVRPGFVSSIQTFGSFANFHPHIHAIVSDGAFGEEGEFFPLSGPPPVELIEEIFRRLLLHRLHQAHRLSESFLHRLLSWHPSGFSVHAGAAVLAEEGDRLERLARTVTRSPFRIDSVAIHPEGLVAVATPAHPRSGATRILLDPLDWIHAVTQQIPDRGQHLARYYGAYANRARGAARRRGRPDRPAAGPELRPSCDPVEPPDLRRRKASWARLLRKVFEVDPLLCPRCGSRLRVVSVITETRVVDHILRHVERKGLPSPLDERAPPAA